ncbi:peptidoglycan-recognition protein 1-like [Coccinella septempunctata]|uniref:peptidoglycan-recognition protein 1-like n=1 Tax=Coccinella septempunctata TaxID=41139 RepID=UPI001D075042|nr:peptidoglycan-recognition protein 1-like [Coccinella septempunctata]
MFYNSNPPPTRTCRVCMMKYNYIINDIASETTPLIYGPTKKKRCTDGHAVFFLGTLTFLLFLGMTIGFRLLIVEYREAEPSYVISLASRHNWRAVRVDKNEDLAPPCNKLILVFTNSPTCYDQQNCTKEIRSLQERSLRENDRDLPYNFIIANDDRIYEGRGWHYAPDISPYSDNSTLAFAFLGYPGVTNLTSTQKDQLIILVNLAISHHKLHHCFRVMTRPEEKPQLQEVTDRIQETILDTACG